MLAAARAALDRSDRAAALASLLEAWRAVRDPRIADLVDRVSEELTARLPPITGKTITARTAAWHAIAKQRDPADLVRLLATPLPGTWPTALPVLLELCAWPDDPRLAMGLARILDTVRFTTRSSTRFYTPLFARLGLLRDVRALPLLRAQLDKLKGFGLRELDSAAVATLEAEPAIALPAELVDDLAALEARYADRTAHANDTTDGEQMLAAILADPDDLTARTVYADWLQERGDPRGEFIALQLARGDREVATARERKLLDEHGRRWAGPAGDWFDLDSHRFDRGFFAGGTLRHRLDQIPDPLDPGWRLVRVIAARYSHTEQMLLGILERRDLATVRAVHVMDEVGSAIASGPPRMLHELVVGRRYADFAGPADHPLATCAALPELRVLGLGMRHSLSLLAPRAPVFERIERLVVGIDITTTAELLPLAERAGALREIVLMPGRDLAEQRPWRVSLQRDVAPGPFTRFVARYRIGIEGDTDLFVALDAPLRFVPADWLREVVVEPGRKLTIKAAVRTSLASTIAGFPKLERIDVPWETPKPRAPIAGEGYKVVLHGAAMLDPARVTAVWPLLAELGQQYDSFEVGRGGTLRPLGTEPLDRVLGWAKNKRATALQLVRDGEPSRVVLARSAARPLLITLAGIEVAPRQLAAWFVRLLDLAPFTRGALDLAARTFRPEQIAAEYAPAVAGWLVVIPGTLAPYAPINRLAALATRPELAGLFVERAAHHVVVGLAATPGLVDQARVAAFEDQLRNIVETEVSARAGYDFRARAAAVLEPVTTALGLTRASTPSRRYIYWHDASSPSRKVTCYLSGELGSPEFTVTQGSAAQTRYPACRQPAPTAERFEELLAKCAQELQATGGAWFAEASAT